jgi:aminoglycoside phosphotransferase (APT) family kinase protein
MNYLISLQKSNKYMIINEILVQNLIASQFPEWKNLPIRSVSDQGWDNRTFRLGDELLVRLPSSQKYTFQVEKEQAWLPKIAPHLPCAIPVPIALGQPEVDYPWKWSIYKWLKGESALHGQIDNLEKFAHDLAIFMNTFQQIDTTGGPLPSAQNFYRGGSLLNYDGETRKAISLLAGNIDHNAALELWGKAINTKYTGHSVWVHGDISLGNLLVADGNLSAVIDFGQLAVGDPACDLTIAWTMLHGKSRELFIQYILVDQGTWIRAQAWGLWKALIIAAGISEANNSEKQNSFRIIREILG